MNKVKMGAEIMNKYADGLPDHMRDDTEWVFPTAQTDVIHTTTHFPEISVELKSDWASKIHDDWVDATRFDKFMRKELAFLTIRGSIWY